MASIYDLYIEQGSTFSKQIDITGDYTGDTISCDIVDSVGNILSGVVSWVDDATGVFLISITSAQTSALVKGIGKYNIEVTDGTTRDRLLQGRVYVDGDVA